MRLPTLALAAVAPATPAAAQQQPPAAPPFPSWDIRAHCERQQRVMNMESATMMNVFLDRQEAARDDLAPNWDAIPAQVRRHCIQQQRTIAMQDYGMLAFCAEREVAALQRLQRR